MQCNNNKKFYDLYCAIHGTQGHLRELGNREFLRVGAATLNATIDFQAGSGYGEQTCIWGLFVVVEEVRQVSGVQGMQGSIPEKDWFFYMKQIKREPV